MTNVRWTRWSLPTSLWVESMRLLPKDDNGNRLYRKVGQSIQEQSGADELIAIELSDFEVSLFGPQKLSDISDKFYGS